jgi:hypothetical protein
VNRAGLLNRPNVWLGAPSQLHRSVTGGSGGSAVATLQRVRKLPVLVLSPIGPQAIAAGCDQGANEHREGDAKENFDAYH